MFKEARRNSNRRPKPGTLAPLSACRARVTGRYRSANRAARVADLARQVRAGTYAPDLTAVAARVLKDIKGRA